MRSSESEHAQRLRRSYLVLEIIKFAILAFIIITPIRLFVAQPFIVSGASMEPTFNQHEYLVIDRLTYRFEEPQRGDVVVFRYPLDPAVYFVKRIIGLPGERIEIVNNRISITSSEGYSLLDEPYITETISLKDMVPITLEDNEYFVMGDNRRASSDSRVWGPLPKRDIIGRPIARLFPFNRIDMNPGVHQFDAK